MYQKCIICDSLADELVLNGLPMKKCRQCGLIWRKSFDIPIEHYEEIDRGLNPKKLKLRFLNSKGRVNLFKKYVDLNNLCDVGCWEGMFLKVLQDSGYKNVMGIEPSDKIAEFTKEHHLDIQKGTIENMSSIVNNRNIRTITMFHVIEHLEDPLASLKNIYNNLPIGGYLIIETPDIDAYSLRKRNYQHRTIYPEHYFYFNENNLKTLLEKIGFNIIARGRREFDPVNINIRESLFRLGISKKRYDYNAGYKPATKPDYCSSFGFKNFLISKIKNIIRFILWKMVTILKRQEFIWIIAKK